MKLFELLNTIHTDNVDIKTNDRLHTTISRTTQYSGVSRYLTRDVVNVYADENLTLNIVIECDEQDKNELAEKLNYLIEFASLIDNEKDCNMMLRAIDRVLNNKMYMIDPGDKRS